MKSADRCIVVIGKESAGKSQLISSLTGRSAYASNFRGTTIACEKYQADGRVFVDTPGILRQSDAATTRAALSQVEQSDTLLLVVQATHIDDDLSDLLPLAKGKRGVAAVTFWDKVHATGLAAEALDKLSQSSGLPFIPVDARKVNDDERSRILAALDNPKPITCERMRVRAGWRLEPPPTLLEAPYLGLLVAVFLLILPAISAIWIANSFAGLIDRSVQPLITPLVKSLGEPRSALTEILVGDYGLLTMGPLLFVWAVPTVVLYALFLGSYKASGLIDRITAAMHPLMRLFGLSGYDLVRVIMGFGCNVPAVISTRACSACSRGTCILAISFGSACSYQFGATLGVFAIAGLSYLVVPYLLFLTATTLIYTRLTAPPKARSPLNLLLVERRAFLEWSRWTNVWRESRSTLAHFFRRAIPLFFLITVVASVLDWLGIINALARIFGTLMALFRLPTDAALPVMLSSIRKDGILLFGRPDLIATLTPGQLLTGVYLAGVLLPCLVTALAIMREQSARFVLKLIGKQMLAAIFFSLILAQVSTLFS